MANFNIQITNRGRALQAKAQAGTPLVFTRMRLGSGSLSGQQIADMTALIDPKLWLAINKSVASSAGKHTVGAYLKSDNVTTGFYFREWGVFAQDPDLGEILYCYGNVGAGAEYIAAGGGSDSVEKQLDAITIIGNAANVSAVLDESLVFTSRSEFENHTNAEELDHPDGSVTAAKLANGAANDDKIGERTISDAAAPTSNKGKLTVLLSGLAYMYKAVTGEETWRTLPSTTIKAIKAILDAATNLATANTFMKRDANGRAKVAAPSATDDIARKAEVDTAIISAASDATSKANAAQSAAITAAASDATSKANAVQSNLNTHTGDTTIHITSAERTSWNAKETTTGAQTKADAAKNAAISAAATDATSKANAAQSAAISAAASDATSKANAAQSAAISAAASDATIKADAALGAAKDYSVNAVAPSATAIDPNTTQYEFIVSNHANAPINGAFWYIRTWFYASKFSSKSQIAIQYNGGSRLFTRSYYEGTWTSWVEFSPIDSPKFTGIPTAPTAAASTNTAQIANAEFTQAAIRNYVNARSLPDNANLNNFIDEGHYYAATSGGAGTMSNNPAGAIAFNLTVKRGAGAWKKQELSAITGPEWMRWYNGDNGAWYGWKSVGYLSPTFEGTPTAPTADIWTINNQIATGKYVHEAIDQRNLYGTTAGSSTAYSLTFGAPPSSLVPGMRVMAKLHTATGANPTLNINGLGAKALYAADGVSRFVGVTGRIYTFVYDGTNFILASGGGWNTGDIIPLDNLAIETGDVITQAWADSSVGIGQDVAIDIYGNVYCAHSVSSGKTLRKLTPTGEEIWANTELGSTSGVAVDASGNVYCVNNLISGKTVRKFNSSGTELWSKTDIQYGRGVAVDGSGNVYCAHGASSGKTVRKLNSSGTEIWANTSVPNGEDVVVDTSGNVYCAHSVSSYGKTIRKLNSSGTEIWGNTDAQYGGNGVAVDESGNVYCANTGSIGEKTIRKLNSSGTEIWANTEGGHGNGVDVDRIGNVYCANGGGGSKLMRKLNPSGMEVWGVTGLTTGQSIKVDSSSGNVYCAHSGTSSGVTIRKLFQNILGHKVL